MDNKDKRIISSLAYFTLMAIAFVITDLFVWSIASVVALPVWIRIIYYIWSGALMIFIVFDLIATIIGKYKFTTGIAYYIITLLAIAMAVIVYFVYVRGATTTVPAEITQIGINYAGIMALNGLATCLAVVGYFFGFKKFKYARKYEVK